jgi:hypothetical protein
LVITAVLALALLLALDSDSGAAASGIGGAGSGGGGGGASASSPLGGVGGVRLRAVASAAAASSVPPVRAEAAQVYTLLAGSGDFGGVPHARLGAGEPFVGAPSLHMSSHRCVGSPPLNGSCAFRNLYFASVPHIGEPEAWPTHHSGDWTYALSVPEEEVACGLWPAAALRDLVWATEVELRVAIISRLPESESRLWAIAIAVLSAQPAESAAAAAAAQPGRRRVRVPVFAPERPPWLPLSRKPEDLVLDVASAAAHGACPLNPLLPRGVACVPPGVSAAVLRPLFLLLRTNKGNIGHSLWDDCVPFLVAMEDLGLSPRLREFDLLVSEEAGPWERTWTAPHVRALFTFTSPGGAPVEVAALDERLRGGRVALVPEVVGGLWGMSPHNLRPDLKVYGAERRAVWRWRNHALAAAGFSEAEVLRPALEIVPSEPGKLRLLFVRGKRPLWNERVLLEALRREFAAQLTVDAFGGEDVRGGLREEMAHLMRTHIFMAMDGTVSLTTPFLPRGAVHVQLGVARPWGSQVQCDFLFSSLDHVRVLFYGALAPGEHSNVTSGGFAVPLAKIAPLLREAIALVRAGAPADPEAPLVNASDANLAPSAKLLTHLFRRHPALPGLLYSGRTDWELFKVEPYEIGVPRLFRRKVAASNASADAFDAETKAFCAAHACSP